MGTAKDALNLEDFNGDALQGNIDPEMDPTNRSSDDFAANKVDAPNGGYINP